MKFKIMAIQLEGDDESISAQMPDGNVSVGILSKGSVLVCNKEEERIYHLHKTEHGGYVLKEGTLL